MPISCAINGIASCYTSICLERLKLLHLPLGTSTRGMVAVGEEKFGDQPPKKRWPSAASPFLPELTHTTAWKLGKRSLEAAVKHGLWRADHDDKPTP